MKEDLLHYVWQHQEFTKNYLTTSNGEDVRILSVGVHNYDAGPDFSGARIQIGHVLWSGAVEIHIKASDWHKHKHHLDVAYNNVVLHVVWEYDAPAYRSDGTILPVLELRRLIDLQTIQRYQQYFQEGYQQERKLLCTSHIQHTDSLTVLSAMERALVSRLNQKANEVLLLLEGNRGDWQSTIFQWLAKGFGFKKNADPMLALSKSIPFRLVLQHQQSLTELEALLMGQAGFLAFESDHPYWHNTLTNTYDFLNRKFQLNDLRQPINSWKFSRMRPANFPTLRLAQLAALLHQHAHQIVILLAIEYAEGLKIFTNEPSSFWQSHYHPQRRSSLQHHTLGADSIHNLMINVVAPLQYAHAMHYQDMEKAESVFNMMQKLPAEKNSIVGMYKKAGFPATSAYDTQAVLGLHYELCQKHRCLQCCIGDSILRSQITNSQSKVR